LAQDPTAHSCYQAALSDWTAEVVGFRLVAGVLGGLALAGYFLIRHRWTRRQRFGTLPAAVIDTLAVTLFGLSGLWTLGLGVDWLAHRHNGAGQWLAAAPVALAVAGYYGIRVVAELRRAPT
jgi:H+/Cl- antiporter ClcA